MTIRMVAKREKIPLDDVKVTLQKSLSKKNEKGARTLQLTRNITLEGNLENKQRERLMIVADRCPVHKSLSGDIDIHTVENE